MSLLFYAVGSDQYGKSSIEEVLKPLRRLEMAALEVHEKECDEYQATEFVAKENQRVIGEKVRKALKDNRDPEPIALEALQANTEPPRRRRYILRSINSFRLHSILQ